MRQTRLPARNMVGPIRWSCAGNDPKNPQIRCSHSVYLDVPQALVRADIVFGSTFLATASPPSTPALRSNRHSGRCGSVPQSRDFVPWRFSDAAGRRAWQSCA
jgi:hypothetical protein